jgi:glucose 1-dehydrogenase
MSEKKYPEVVMPQCEAEKVLKGQKALVTGANSGIGKAVAIGLGQAGADVVVNYVRGEDQAREVVAEIKKSGSRAFAHPADVSSEDQVQAMFQKMFSEFGTIDILVNNAGLQKDAPFDEMTLADWNLVINVNLTGQFLCARQAVKEFKRRGVVKEISCAAGKIIHMSSVHEVIPWAGHVNYAASKGLLLPIYSGHGWIDLKRLYKKAITHRG